MISLLALLPAFYWLLLESDYLRVRLPCGKPLPIPLLTKPTFERLFCYNGHGETKHGGVATWKLPARIVNYYGQNNFKAGCNLCRTRVLKSIRISQRHQTPTTYHSQLPFPQLNWTGSFYSQAIPPLCGRDWLEKHKNDSYPEPEITITVNGGASITVNGNYKRSTIKDFMKDYCRPGEGKIRLVKVR